MNLGGIHPLSSNFFFFCAPNCNEFPRASLLERVFLTILRKTGPREGTSVSLCPVTPFSLLVLPPGGISPACVDQVPSRELLGGCWLPLRSCVLAPSPAVPREASHAWRVTGCQPHFCRGPRALTGHKGTRRAVSRESRPPNSQRSHHDGQAWV